MSTEANELDVKFDDIDLSYPRLSKGVYELLITSISRVESPDNDYLKIGLQTTADCTDTSGQTHPAGFKTSCVIGLKPFATGTMDDVNKAIAGLVRGCGVTGLSKGHSISFKILASSMNDRLLWLLCVQILHMGQHRLHLGGVNLRLV